MTFYPSGHNQAPALSDANVTYAFGAQCHPSSSSTCLNVKNNTNSTKEKTLHRAVYKRIERATVNATPTYCEFTWKIFHPLSVVSIEYTGTQQPTKAPLPHSLSTRHEENEDGQNWSNFMCYYFTGNLWTERHKKLAHEELPPPKRMPNLMKLLYYLILCEWEDETKRTERPNSSSGWKSEKVKRMSLLIWNSSTFTPKIARKIDCNEAQIKLKHYSDYFGGRRRPFKFTSATRSPHLIIELSLSVRKGNNNNIQ